MKVIVLSHMYPSAFNDMWGIFVHEQVKALVAKGVEVRVVSPEAWIPFPVDQLTPKWKAYNAIPDKDTWEGIEVWHPRYLMFPRAWFFDSSGRRMYRAIRRLVEVIHIEFPFDLIHAHVALPDGYAAALLARGLEKPLVITIHGQDLQRTITRSSACHQGVAYALNFASKVILVSSKLRRIANVHFEIDEKLVIVANGVDPLNIAQEEHLSTDWHKEGLTLLSVSNLIKTKGIDLNLLALHQLHKKYPDLHYVVIGGGPEEARLRRLAKRLGLEERVEFLGGMPHYAVMARMAASDIFSLPSWKEGFGVVYLEAMVHGKPVIACRGEGIQDVVSNRETGLLVEPKDLGSLVEALDFLISHPQEAQAIGERAKELVLQEYTWEKSAQKTIKVYEEALGNRVQAE